ncbi:hypothetical protein Dtox_4261 [Desulfofarcimen acetoxidans DSM 771]|jgi:hypothetical protein|uniref:Uncharacterized protein n=1 Tax=Desulfofarcimen acetoxidans (strain ATCC 49208 / DSM 771 / KCTC 5769 / VKM B-1644 / 5575) TaxID=485916 RepID=C8VZI3_DESAS|nr:hypothetical protein Dtox_4261 [Desulfofarcimen acetoxidans DSM 771]
MSNLKIFHDDLLGICLKEESPIYSCHPAIHPVSNKK